MFVTSCRPAERQRFEKQFLASAERRKRVEFARALTAVMEEEAVPKKAVVHETNHGPGEKCFTRFFMGCTPATRIAFALAVPLLLIGAGYLFVETLRLRRELTQVQTKYQSQQTSQQQALELDDDAARS